MASSNNNQLDTHEENINIISRQTTYNREIIISKLKFHNNSVDNVIREYMLSNKQKSVNESTNMKKKTTNQVIFSEIRKLMDEACLSYQRKKEASESTLD